MSENALVFQITRVFDDFLHYVESTIFLANLVRMESLAKIMDKQRIL